MKPFSYETTRQNVMYCVENEDIKGIVIYKFTKPEQVFENEIKIARNIFKSSFGKTLLNSIKYVFKNSKKILWKFIKKYCLPNIGINISNRVYKLIYSY